MTALEKSKALLWRMQRFFVRHEFLVCAVNQVPPFDASLDWPHEIEGVTMEHYAAWMKSAYWISTTRCPAASVPAGKTADGLPVGMQIVAPYLQDRRAIRVAQLASEVLGGYEVPPGFE